MIATNRGITKKAFVFATLVVASLLIPDVADSAIRQPSVTILRHWCAQKAVTVQVQVRFGRQISEVFYSALRYYVYNSNSQLVGRQGYGQLTGSYQGFSHTGIVPVPGYRGHYILVEFYSGPDKRVVWSNRRYC
jgi:hypothetical protein